LKPTTNDGVPDELNVSTMWRSVDSAPNARRAAMDEPAPAVQPVPVRHTVERMEETA